MKTALRLILTLLLCTILFLCLTSNAFAEIVDSGKWGSLDWTLDDEGTLTISGEGSMNDFNYSSTGAWRSLKDDINSVIIESGVTSIGSYAFSNCTGLTSVTIPDRVTSIGDHAFSGCSGLNEVHITDLAAWCQIAFSRYDSNPLYFAHNLYLNNELVTALVIPTGVTSIGDDAFYGCSGLTSVTIPDSVTSIGGSAFSECSSLNAVHITDLAAWCQIAFSGRDSNPLYYAHNLYLNNELVTALVIPTGVTSIGGSAFSGCRGLTSVTIGSGVTSIGVSAFSLCTGLTSVTIGSGVTSIGSNAFRLCSGLTDVTIPDSVTSISGYAFEGCTGLTSVTIPDSVTSIGSGAFYHCSGLTSVTIGNGVTSIGGSAFSGCSGLTSVTIPDSVTSIGGYAFYGCDGLTNVTIPDSVTSIGEGAFSYCYSLTDVYYTGTQEKWNSINFGDYNERLTGAIIHFGPTPDFILPASLTEIGEKAFYGGAFTYVKLSENTVTIGKNAFANCPNLTYIYIPEATTDINAQAFGTMTELTIYGAAGSTAQTFAEAHGFTFVSVS